MAINSDNAHAWTGDGVVVAPEGSTLPTDTTSDWDAAFADLGWLSDQGITEQRSGDRKEVRGFQNGGGLVTIIKSNDSRAFKFQALEENAAVLGLLRPGSTPTSTGGANDVQTVTITGTPTGGTFTLTLDGQTTSAIVYNAASTAVQSALEALSNVGAGNVAVSGSTGGPYTVTFQGEKANQAVSVMTANGASLTGGTTPSVTVAHTTPGTAAVTTTKVKTANDRDLRMFGLDLRSGGVHKRLVVKSGEVTGTGDVVYKSDDITVYEFTVTCYPQADGELYTEITDNPAAAV